MSWTDQQSVNVIKYLRDKYAISTLIETGSFKGINARLHSKNFNLVMTCEKHNAYYEEAKENLKDYSNVIIKKEDSPDFVKRLSINPYIFYLDAHFYDPSLPTGKEKFVVLKELKNMKKFKNSIIIIHDVNNGLGHITYDGMDLNIELLEKSLKRINKRFHFYTNTLEGCNVVKNNAAAIRKAGLTVDYDTLDNLDYAWSSPRLTYRGFLYCLPDALSAKELKKLGLRKWK